MRRYDATDFGTPITGFDATRNGNSARIVISVIGEYEQLAYQSDDSIRRRSAADAQERGLAGGEARVHGRAPHAQLPGHRDTRAVLQLLADASGQNIVVSDSVKGSVTLRLQNVPWDQALDIVLRTKGLDKRKEGNVIIVAPSDELATQEKLSSPRARTFRSSRRCAPSSCR